jgi:hypothetical protein
MDLLGSALTPLIKEPSPLIGAIDTLKLRRPSARRNTL